MVNLADHGYNPENVQAQDYADITNGMYDFEIQSWEVKDTQKGGKQLIAEIKLLGGDFDNRRLFHRMNLAGMSEQALEIGQRQIKELFVSLGLDENETNPDAMLNGPIGKVKIGQKGTREYNGNEYMEYNIYPQKPKGIQPAPAQTPADTKAPQAAADGSTPSWGAPTAQDGNTGGL